MLRYYRRAVRLSRIPIFGKSHSVVMVVRQPVDIDGSRAAYERFLIRVAMAANGRFPPWRGLVIGLTALVLTPEPIGPGDDAMLREVLGIKLRRMRVVPFGLIRVNLGQEAIALAINNEPRRPLHRARRVWPTPCASSSGAMCRSSEGSEG